MNPLHPRPTGAGGALGRKRNFLAIILIDGSGQPNILYKNGSNNLYVARRQADGVTWLDHNVLPEVDFPSFDRTRAGTLTRGPGGRQMLCYYDAFEHDVMFAWKPELHITLIKKKPSLVQLDWEPKIDGVWIDRSPDLRAGSWTPVAGPLDSNSHVFVETADHMNYRIRPEFNYTLFGVEP